MPKSASSSKKKSTKANTILEGRFEILGQKKGIVNLGFGRGTYNLDNLSEKDAELLAKKVKWLRKVE